MYKLTFIILAIILFSCQSSSEKIEEEGEVMDSLVQEEGDKEFFSKEKESIVRDTIEVEMRYAKNGFSDKIYYDLLVETKICNPNYADSATAGTTPCSSKFFNFYPYNSHREIEDAFILQARAGVNGYPYRRMLIFVREQGKLVLMNGAVGYLVQRIPTDSGIDDLIVAIFDDLGNDKFDRYDVLLRYSEGKYRFVEAVGDLEGKFLDEDLKKRATTAIGQRIIEKELLF